MKGPCRALFVQGDSFLSPNKNESVQHGKALYISNFDLITVTDNTRYPNPQTVNNQVNRIIGTSDKF